MKNQHGPIRLLLVDDDALSREVMTLQIAGQGYAVDPVDSGAAALLHLEKKRRQLPHIVLTDLQMPGITGNELAKQIRTIFHLTNSSARILLFAMSASRPHSELSNDFDGFLLKPFTMKQLAAALDKGAPAFESKDIPPSNQGGPELDETIYRRMADSMPAAQLAQLYMLCVQDAEVRMERMRLAAIDGDDTTYRREAHSVRGGCSMVGASQMRALAGAAEESGLSNANHVASLNEMLTACDRLRRILVAREDGATFSGSPEVARRS